MKKIPGSPLFSSLTKLLVSCLPIIVVLMAPFVFGYEWNFRELSQTSDWLFASAFLFYEVGQDSDLLKAKGIYDDVGHGVVAQFSLLGCLISLLLVLPIIGKDHGHPITFVEIFWRIQFGLFVTAVTMFLQAKYLAAKTHSMHRS